MHACFPRTVWYRDVRHLQKMKHLHCDVPNSFFTNGLSRAPRRNLIPKSATSGMTPESSSQFSHSSFKQGTKRPSSVIEMSESTYLPFASKFWYRAVKDKHPDFFSLPNNLQDDKERIWPRLQKCIWKHQATVNATLQTLSKFFQNVFVMTL